MNKTIGLSNQNISIIQDALNFYWNDAAYNLAETKNLGDVQKENYTFIKESTKPLLDTFCDSRSFNEIEEVRIIKKTMKINNDYCVPTVSIYHKDNVRCAFKDEQCKIVSVHVKGVDSFITISNSKDAIFALPLDLFEKTFILGKITFNSKETKDTFTDRKMIEFGAYCISMKRFNNKAVLISDLFNKWKNNG